MEPEPADVRRLVTMILESSGGEETVDWWLLINGPQQRAAACSMYLYVDRALRERAERLDQ